MIHCLATIDGLVTRFDRAMYTFAIPFDTQWATPTEDEEAEIVTGAIDMSFSLVSICNMALGKCGVTQPISALEFSADERVSTEARLCALYFELSFRAAARGYDWACLKTQADISGNLTTSPAAGYAYAYALPNNYVGSLKVLDETIEWKKVGKTIQTDATEIQIEYVQYTLNTDLYDDLFTEALVMRLAAHLAPALCGENATQIANNLIEWHERISMPQAMLADARERSVVETDSSTWRDSRL